MREELPQFRAEAFGARDLGRPLGGYIGLGDRDMRTSVAVGTLVELVSDPPLAVGNTKSALNPLVTSRPVIRSRATR